MPRPEPHHGASDQSDSSIRLLRMAAVAATIALLAALAPVIWTAVSAGLGLAALAALGLCGVVAAQSMPLALQKLENRLLRLRRQEARANPIEQLQNDCLRREEWLQSFRRALATIGGQIDSMSQMLEDRRHQDPLHVLDRQQRAVQRMTQFYNANLLRLDAAQEALQAFRHQVKQKTFELEFAQAGQVAMAALNPREMEDLVQGLLTDESLRSVQDRFNTVFAELDVELRSIDSPTRPWIDQAGLDRFDALSLPELQPQRRPA